VAWSQFKTQGNTKSHPQGDRSVPKIELTVGTNTQTFDIGGQRCQVTVKYGSTSLSVGTGTNGKGLSVSTDFTSFRPGADENHLEHADATKTISSIVVTKAGKRIYRGRPTGAVKIVIHYQ
jgi:YbbR domain-containing protein